MKTRLVNVAGNVVELCPKCSMAMDSHGGPHSGIVFTCPVTDEKPTAEDFGNPNACPKCHFLVSKHSGPIITSYYVCPTPAGNLPTSRIQDVAITKPPYEDERAWRYRPPKRKKRPTAKTGTVSEVAEAMRKQLPPLIKTPQDPSAVEIKRTNPLHRAPSLNEELDEHPGDYYKSS